MMESWNIGHNGRTILKRTVSTANGGWLNYTWLLPAALPGRGDRQRRLRLAARHLPGAAAAVPGRRLPGHHPAGHAARADPLPRRHRHRRPRGRGGALARAAEPTAIPLRARRHRLHRPGPADPAAAARAGQRRSVAAARHRHRAGRGPSAARRAWEQAELAKAAAAGRGQAPPADWPTLPVRRVLTDNVLQLRSVLTQVAALGRRWAPVRLVPPGSFIELSRPDLERWSGRRRATRSPARATGWWKDRAASAGRSGISSSARLTGRALASSATTARLAPRPRSAAARRRRSPRRGCWSRRAPASCPGSRTCRPRRR